MSVDIDRDLQLEAYRAVSVDSERDLQLDVRRVVSVPNLSLISLFLHHKPTANWIWTDFLQFCAQLLTTAFLLARV